jgi:cbb3-type cytochrome oxidase maturation protein
MSFLAITIPATLLLSGTLLWLVVRAARRGEFDDFEGPSRRMLGDDDRCPERDAALDPEAPAPPGP